MMMIDKAAVMAVAVIMTVIGTGCKPGSRYGDLEQYLNEAIEINEEYVAAIEKADSAREMVKAIDEMSMKSEKLAKQAGKIKDKYPDLAQLAKNPPEELKDEFEKLNDLALRLLGVTGKIMKYMMDPAVMKASKKMADESGRTGVFR